jgi:hypothetical protein
MNVTRIIPVLGVIDALMGLDDACFTLPTFRTLRIEERAKYHFALQSPRPARHGTRTTRPIGADEFRGDPERLLRRMAQLPA